jgi:hypothetical protein
MSEPEYPCLPKYESLEEQFCELCGQLIVFRMNTDINWEESDVSEEHEP